MKKNVNNRENKQSSISRLISVGWSQLVYYLLTTSINAKFMWIFLIKILGKKYNKRTFF